MIYILYTLVSLCVTFIFLHINHKREMLDMKNKMEFLNRVRDKELSEGEREILIKIANGENFLGS